MIFRLEDIGKEFSGTWIFSGVHAVCKDRDRIGLIGRNGSGKSTLLQIIQGDLNPDSGVIHRRAATAIARVPQSAEFDADKSVRDTALEVFDEFRRIEKRLVDIEKIISTSRSLEASVSQEYEELRLRMRLHGGYDYRARTESVLFGLGFAAHELDLPCGHLSGGQQNRLLLARVLLQPADLMLLDEPTNHLDLQGIFWLRSFLNDVKTAFIVISHDRDFLDAVTTSTWEIEQGTLEVYPAPFSRSRSLREERIELQRKAYEKQREFRLQTEDFIRRNIAGQKTRQAQSRRKLLERMETIDAPIQSTSTMRLRIPEAPRGGELTFAVESGSFGFPDVRLLEKIDLSVRRGEKIAILGSNGSGKSTFLKTLIGEIPLLSGKIRWGVHCVPAYFTQKNDFGDEDASVFDVLSQQSISWTDQEIRTFAALFLFRGDDVFQKISSLSGGERSRLSLARLFSRPSNLLLLDEPTNHLDIQSRQALEEALSRYSGSLVLVSHDLHFVREVADRFLLIQDRRLTPVGSLNLLPQLLMEKEDTQRQDGTDGVMQSVRTTTNGRAGLSKNEVMRRRLRLEELERDIEMREERKEALQQQMEVNTSDHEELLRLSHEFAGLEDELHELYGEWERTAAELAEAGN